MKRRIVLPLALIGIIVALLLTGVHWADTRNRSQAVVSTHMRLAQNTVPMAALTIIAAKKGFFTAEGLDVTVSSFPSGKLALDAALGGGADVATVAETPLARAGIAGVPVAVIANIASSDNDIKLAYNRAGGTRRISDLKSKSIALPVGTSAEYFASVFFKAHGIVASDMRIVNLSPALMIQALRSGSIDAFIVWEPYPTLASKSISDVAVMDQPGLYNETFNIALRPAYLTGHTDSLRHLLVALRRAQNFAKNEKEQAIDLVAKETGIDRATLSVFWPQFRFEVKDPEGLSEILNKEEAWIEASGTTPRVGNDPSKLMLDSSIIKVAK